MIKVCVDLKISLFEHLQNVKQGSKIVLTSIILLHLSSVTERVCNSVFIPVSVSFSICQFVCQSVYVSISISVLCVCVSVCPSVCVCVCVI